ncbi:MAG TPA: DUF6499 domain-containing protein [Gammaproteobacteria bacterium]|nr:DUF6499 domain-containing protein [Gammaproteobacteria bacterium]
MEFRRWDHPQDYAFTQHLCAAQWAWEFLRRNPLYQAEWVAFDTVWRELETQYGAPPDRDFCAWKLDPRAWVRAADCPEGDCRVDQDKVLIECALGARWGFYKFPPDPSDDDPVGEGRLVWRDVETEARILGLDDTQWLGGDAAWVAIGFDLSLPLRDQIERAKRALQLLQRRRRQSGDVPAFSIATQRDRLRMSLRLLDASAAGAPEAALMSISSEWRDLLAKASVMRDGGYRQLTTWPD